MAALGRLRRSGCSLVECPSRLLPPSVPGEKTKIIQADRRRLAPACQLFQHLRREIGEPQLSAGNGHRPLKAAWLCGVMWAIAQRTQNRSPGKLHLTLIQRTQEVEYLVPNPSVKRVLARFPMPRPDDQRRFNMHRWDKDIEPQSVCQL